MDPATILALIQAGMPLLQEMLQMAVMIAQTVEAAQAQHIAAPTPATANILTSLTALQTQQATTASAAVKAVQAVAAAK